MDKVKLHAQQRLDLDDARALQTLVYNYVAEALGGVLGHVSGCLSRVQTVAAGPSTAAPTYIELGAFSFITTTRQGSSSFSTNNTYHQARTVVVNYDPSDLGQQTQINFAQARNNHADYDGTSTGGKLWARPIYQNTDTANRIKWESAANKEATFSAQTRESQRVEFQFATSEPSRGGGERWSAIALVSIADGNPTTIPFLTPISAWDTDQNESLLDTWFETSGVSRDNRSFRDLLLADVNFPTETDGELRMSGLALQLSAIRLQLSRLLSLGSNDSSVTAQDWYDQPLASVAGLHARTVTLEAATAGALIAACTVEGTHNSGVSPYYTFTTKAGTDTVGLADPSPLVNPVRGNNGTAGQIYLNRVNIQIHPDVIAQGWKIVSVQCTSADNETATGTQDHVRFNRLFINVAPECLTANLGSSATLLDDNQSNTAYGVMLDVLPHIIDTAHGHSEDEVHLPTLSNYPPSGSPTTLWYDGDQVIFTVAIFAKRVLIP